MREKLKTTTKHIYHRYRLHAYVLIGIVATLLAVFFAWHGLDVAYDRAEKIAELDLAPLFEAWLAKGLEEA